jgi:hypothetical protein
MAAARRRCRWLCTPCMHPASMRTARWAAAASAAEASSPPQPLPQLHLSPGLWVCLPPDQCCSWLASELSPTGGKLAYHHNPSCPPLPPFTTTSAHTTTLHYRGPVRPAPLGRPLLGGHAAEVRAAAQLPLAFVAMAGCVPDQGVEAWRPNVRGRALAPDPAHVLVLQPLRRPGLACRQRLPLFRAAIDGCSGGTQVAYNGPIRRCPVFCQWLEQRGSRQQAAGSRQQAAGSRTGSH